ncbi:hypothetical protein AS361_17490 [Myroides marinus]|uniref:hypothetical protein n=1 Tax=Myroides marinus TaxID=703342 RepID=UPI0007420D39|nr:hypothetical protein [Myroides marinus]KUF41649.1 hypothetical protein AS361_17490 [Myroides marinus]
MQTIFGIIFSIISTTIFCSLFNVDGLLAIIPSYGIGVLIHEHLEENPNGAYFSLILSISITTILVLFFKKILILTFIPTYYISAMIYSNFIGIYITKKKALKELYKQYDLLYQSLIKPYLAENSKEKIYFIDIIFKADKLFKTDSRDLELKLKSIQLSKEDIINYTDTEIYNMCYKKRPTLKILSTYIFHFEQAKDTFVQIVDYDTYQKHLSELNSKKNKLKEKELNKIKSLSQETLANTDKISTTINNNKTLLTKKDIPLLSHPIPTNINNLFRNSYTPKTGQEFYYLLDYISNYNIEQFSDSVFKHIRNDFIFKFKEGSYPRKLPIIIAYYIYSNYKNLLDKNNICICIIPASSNENNIARFKKFTQTIADLLNIENGFDYISRTKDKENSRANKKENNPLENVIFSDKLKGKTILLIDDISTKGTSIELFNNKLLNAGCASCINIVLAKTFYHSKTEYNLNNLDELGAFNAVVLKTILA